MKFICFIGFLFSSMASANPKIDRVVREFLTQNKGSDQKISVLLTYKRTISFPIWSNTSRNHSLVQTAMIENTLKNQALVFSQQPGEFKEAPRALWIINSSLARLTAAQIVKLSSSPLVESILFSERKIRIDLGVRKPLAISSDSYTYGLEKMNVPLVRKKYPTLLGHGVRVGVLDTGIEAGHPDLRNKLLLFKNFSPARNPKPEDGFRHGTHVSGTIVGGHASGSSIGVAPEAKLIFGRIFDNKGESTQAQILEAMQWMADPDGNPHTDDFAQIVNSSWSDDAQFLDKDPEEEPFCQVVSSWVQLGMIPVFSAGNAGPDFGTIQIPGACPQSFTVGATEQQDRSPKFSSSGPADWKSISLVKPDIVAPGVDIYSSYGRIDYEKLSGTSMSAPHITGALAVILQLNPNLAVNEAIEILTSTAKDLGDPKKDNTFGWGRVDLFKAVEFICGESKCE